MDHTPLVMRFAGIPGIGQIAARMPISRASAKMMLRQVGLKGAIDAAVLDEIGGVLGDRRRGTDDRSRVRDVWT